MSEIVAANRYEFMQVLATVGACVGVFRQGRSRNGDNIKMCESTNETLLIFCKSKHHIIINVLTICQLHRATVLGNKLSSSLLLNI